MATSPSLITHVPIQETFDIARARTALRTKIAQQRWPILFNARASAILTALGELILESRDTRCAVVKIEIISHLNRFGVKLNTHFRLSQEMSGEWLQRKENLQMVVTDIQIEEADREIEITTYVWVE